MQCLCVTMISSSVESNYSTHFSPRLLLSHNITAHHCWASPSHSPRRDDTIPITDTGGPLITATYNAAYTTSLNLYDATNNNIPEVVCSNINGTESTLLNYSPCQDNLNSVIPQHTEKNQTTLTSLRFALNILQMKFINRSSNLNFKSAESQYCAPLTGTNPHVM